MTAHSFTYVSCRKALRTNREIRKYVSDWYDGDIDELLTYRGRFMLRRLVVRAISEIAHNKLMRNSQCLAR